LDQAEEVTTEKHEGDFAAIAWMIRQGSSSWIGPTPRARAARWATKGCRVPVRLVPRGGLHGVLFTAVVFLTVVAVAASMTPGGIMSWQRTVSDVLSQKGPRAPVAPATVSAPATDATGQSPETSTSPAPAASGAARTPAPGSIVRSGVNAPKPTPRPSPSPSPTDE
jgi:hypothetical protein